MTAAFDRIARDYSNLWDGTDTGRLQREAVWRFFEPLFRAGDTILDLGCGNGEDALRFARRGVRVVGIDESSEMVRIARARGVDAYQCRIEDVGQAMLPADRLSSRSSRLKGGCGQDWPPRKTDETSGSRTSADFLSRAHKQAVVSGAEAPLTFDGAVSDFGALNCVADLATLREPLARMIAPGGYLAICVMGRLCLWETVWYLFRGDFRKAVRRWKGSAESSLGIQVYYPTVREIARAFAPGFTLTQAAGIGTWPAFIAISDHRVLIFRRV